MVANRRESTWDAVEEGVVTVVGDGAEASVYELACSDKPPAVGAAEPLMSKAYPEYGQIEVKDHMFADSEVAGLICSTRAGGEYDSGRDDAIDQLEMDIDQESIRYITLRAPVASDLRLVTVGMKTSHELERAAGEASSVAQRTKKILHVGPVENIFSLAEMAKIVQEMLRASIKSFLNEDGLKALAICRRDKEVDHLNDQNTQALTQHIMEQPSHSQISIELIFISKSLERIADHATNIAEEVVFLHSGEDVRHDSALK